MASTYNYSYSVDFGGNLNTAQFHSEVEADGGITPSLIEIKIDGDDVDVVFNSALSGGEETTLTNLVAAHSPSVASVVAYTISKIEEEDVKTNGRFRTECYEVVVDAATGSTTHYDIPSKAFGINVVDAQGFVCEDNHRDRVSLCIGPNTPIGYLATGAASGANTFYVTSTVTANIIPGYYMTITDGTNFSDCGEVQSVDKVNGIVTTALATTTPFDAAPTGTILQSVYMVDRDNFYLPCMTTRIPLGLAKIGASYIPAGVGARITYHNITGGAKNFYAVSEYLY